MRLKDKIILGVCMVFMTASCQRKDLFWMMSGPENFFIDIDACYEGANLTTRAATVDLNYLKSKGFYVYANATNGIDEDPVNFMHDQKVTWNGTSSKWEYAPAKMWPANENAEVDFYAVYKGDVITPNSPDLENIKVMYDWYNKPRTTFYVNDVVSRQTDMLWAAPILNEHHVNEPVRFGFQHSLAGFLFTIKLKDNGDGYYTGYKVTVNSLKLKGYFAPKAEILPDETSVIRAYKLMGDWEERTYTISKDGDHEIKTAVSDPAGAGLTTSEKILTDDKGYIMLLPFAQEYTVELEYTVTGPNGTGIHAAKKTIATTDLVAGNMLKTLLILDPDKGVTPGPGNAGDIQLMVTLIDWKDVNAGEMEIEFE